MELRQARLALALHGQRPAPPICPIRYHKRKSLRGRQSQESLGLRLDRLGVPAAVIQEGRPVLG